jgi:hypothetical protein
VTWGIIDGAQQWTAPSISPGFPYVLAGLICISTGDGATPPEFISAERRSVAREAPLVDVYPGGEVSGDLVIDLDAGAVQELTITGNITNFGFSNRPPAGMQREVCIIRKQDGTGGRTWQHPANTRAAGGTLPGVTSAAGSEDWLWYTISGESGPITVRAELDIKEPT